MDFDALEQLIKQISVWQKHGRRAPHKPLLLLYALSLYKQGHGRLFDYDTEIRDPLLALLNRFGPQRRVQYPNMPFWRLKGDGFWQLQNAQECTDPLRGSKEPSNKRLAECRVAGGFSEPAYALLQSNPARIDRLAQQILQVNFTDSVQEVIANRLGFSLAQVNRQRDPKFRRSVLRAYNYQCAICGYNLRHDDTPVGLEAAHVRWKQSGGPCSVNNGLALCSLHHSAFDMGAIGVSDDLTILISEGVNGNAMVERLFWDFEGKRIYLPKVKQDYPHDRFIAWHLSEVFRG